MANVNYDMCYKRVKDELKDTLTSAAAYNRFVEQGIYKLITPNEINTAHPVRADMSWIVYAGLLGDLSRLELTREEQKILKDYGNPQTDLEIYHAFKDAPHEAALLHGLTKDRRAADRWLDYLRQINLQITGDDLKSLGVVPGAAYGEIFDYVLTEKFKNSLLEVEEMKAKSQEEETKAREERRAALLGLAENFEKNVGGIVTSLAHQAERMQTVSGTLTKAAAQASDLSSRESI